MAALLVSIAVMGVFMTVAMPVWKHANQREKEAELLFRAGQYVARHRALQAAVLRTRSRRTSTC